jgi:hypothetical protein
MANPVGGSLTTRPSTTDNRHITEPVRAAVLIGPIEGIERRSPKLIESSSSAAAPTFAAASYKKSKPVHLRHAAFTTAS